MPPKRRQARLKVSKNGRVEIREVTEPVTVDLAEELDTTEKVKKTTKKMPKKSKVPDTHLNSDDDDDELDVKECESMIKEIKG